MSNHRWRWRQNVRRRQNVRPVRRFEVRHFFATGPRRKKTNVSLAVLDLYSCIPQVITSSLLMVAGVGGEGGCSDEQRNLPFNSTIHNECQIENPSPPFFFYCCLSFGDALFLIGCCRDWQPCRHVYEERMEKESELECNVLTITCDNNA